MSTADQKAAKAEHKAATAQYKAAATPKARQEASAKVTAAEKRLTQVS